MAVEGEGGSQSASMSNWMNSGVTYGMRFSNKREPQNRPSVNEKFLMSRNGFQQRAPSNIHSSTRKQFNPIRKTRYFLNNSKYFIIKAKKEFASKKKKESSCPHPKKTSRKNIFSVTFVEGEFSFP